MIQQIIDKLAGIGPWAYLLEGLLIFAEDALFFGFLLPAETVLVFCAFLAQQHVLDVWVVLAVAIVCAILGDQTGFEIGVLFGPRLEGSPLGRRVGDQRWVAARSFIDKRGGFAVFAGRWVAFLRALVPTTSGMLKMRRLTFTGWNALGGVLWAMAWTAVGYVAGASWESAAKRFGEISAGVALLALAVGLSLAAYYERKKARGGQN